MENNLKNSCSPTRSKGWVVGLILMVIGALFLGVNFGIVPAEYKHILISWPMLIFFIGFVHLFKRHFVSAFVLMLVGGFFLAPRINPALQANFVQVFWPLLLIGAGVAIIVHWVFAPQKICRSRHNWHERHHHGHHVYASRNFSRGEDKNEGFTKNSVFGSGEHIVLDPEFKGGELNAVFGGITLDLRRTNLPEGDTYLDINSVFGGVTIFVPSEWLIETHLDIVFGGFQDNRLTIEPLNTNRKLIITGSCVFGGGEIRN